MKTRLIFLVLLIVSVSCGTNDKSVSDAQKEKIKGEVKEVVTTIIKGAEEANYEMSMSPFLESPDFVYINNGKTINFKEFLDGNKTGFSILLDQKGTLVDEKYYIIDNSTVLYTNNSKWLMNFKDGLSVLKDPWIAQFTFKKIGNSWRVISGNESGSVKIIKVSETPKELNQIELMKQGLGSWKFQLGKDTTVIGETKSYGTGFEASWKALTKGVVIIEGKQLGGFDKTINKYTVCQISQGQKKGRDLQLWATWFTSRNKYETIDYSDISNPEKASWKIEGEFKSPDMFVETMIVNNKPMRTDTYTRVK
jgi:hypothetical protein